MESKSCKTPLKFLREEVIIPLICDKDIDLTVFAVTVLAPSAWEEDEIRDFLRPLLRGETNNILPPLIIV